MSTPVYRPDIDGLRSIAVMLVVIFHSGLTYVSGGFIGVDVFFVISGFLITNIIYRETRERSFTYANFYKRRILRLMPALFAVMLATTIGAGFLLLPNDFISFGKSLLATALSFSNLYFWRENGGYFGGNAHEVPLLHTWSLAVEEQYYFVWPLYLIICHRFMNQRWLLVATGVLFLASLFLSEWVAHVTFGASYYLLPTRMFELMVGSLLAIGWSDLPNLRRRTNDLLSLAGLALIGWSAFCLTESDTFPGYNALYASVGTGLLIMSGHGESGVVNRLLSLRPFVFIGLISYSMYLWHWPIIVFVRHLGIALTLPVSLLLIAASIVSGWLSWKYVEQRFRHPKSTTFRKTFLRLYAAPLLVTAAVTAAILITRGMPARFDDQYVAMEAAIATKPADLRAGCHSASRNSETPPSPDCKLGEQTAPGARALMLGDSHANHFTGFVDVLAKDAGIQVTDYTLDGCIPVFNLQWGHNDYYANICKQRNDISQGYLKQEKFDYVILAAHWPSEKYAHFLMSEREQDRNPQQLHKVLTQKLRETLGTISAIGATPVFIKDGAPAAGSPKCTITKAMFNNALECDIDRATALHQHQLMDQVLQDLAGEFPQLIVIDPKTIMCDAHLCYSQINGTPLYLDSNHLNDQGSRVLAESYLQKVGNPLKRNP